ncbi:hypothetical protein CRG98_001307 [Punica granatum]|uniref:Uncharacterized protein n=1 Tax=Punica granatum TaxID=22663 RepID=A0A2I0LC37_PUNGR|nr:hypothetical protein CRG98_001307 [Punica granatum]
MRPLPITISANELIQVRVLVTMGETLAPVIHLEFKAKPSTARSNVELDLVLGSITGLGALHFKCGLDLEDGPSITTVIYPNEVVDTF